MTLSRDAGKPNLTAGQTVDEMIRGLRVIWLGLLMGPVLFAAVIAVIGGPLWKEPEPSPQAGLFHGILGLLVMGAIVGPLLLERTFVSGLRERAAEINQSADPLLAANVAYRGFFVSRLLIVDAASYFGLIHYLLTGTTEALLAPAASTLWLLFNFPAEDRLRDQVRRAVESA